MNVLILCEGQDDAFITFYYINAHSKNKWKFTQKKFHGFSVNDPEQRLNYYINEADKDKCFLTYSVGGKSKFKLSVEYVIKACEKNNEIDRSLFDEIIILMDKDNDDIQTKIEEINGYFKKWEVSLKDRERCNIKYKNNFDVEFGIGITPIIVPKEGQGAIETAIRQSIASIDEEHKNIIDITEKFVEDTLDKNIVKSYLKKEREVEKAKFSSVVSIINPERSLDDFIDLFDMSSWVEADIAKKHFGILEDILGF